MDNPIRRKSAIYVILAALFLIGVVLSAGSDATGIEGEIIISANDVPSFLSSMGLECDLSSMTEQKVSLPKQFDDTFIAYNSIQLQQNCDLSRYAGKEVTVYTVSILNYPDTAETVLATLIVYKNRVIGGDIHAAAMDGFIVPLKK